MTQEEYTKYRAIAFKKMNPNAVVLPENSIPAQKPVNLGKLHVVIIEENDIDSCCEFCDGGSLVCLDCMGTRIKK